MKPKTSLAQEDPGRPPLRTQPQIHGAVAQHCQNRVPRPNSFPESGKSNDSMEVLRKLISAAHPFTCGGLTLAFVYPKLPGNSIAILRGDGQDFQICHSSRNIHPELVHQSGEFLQVMTLRPIAADGILVGRLEMYSYDLSTSIWDCERELQGLITRAAADLQRAISQNRTSSLADDSLGIVDPNDGNCPDCSNCNFCCTSRHIQ